MKDLMDVPRPRPVGRQRLKRAALAAAALLAIVSLTVGVSSLKRPAPVAERTGLFIDRVRRGPLLRQVRGPGTLVPEEIRWIPAETEGRVERILARPGTAVQSDTVLIVLGNPQLALESLDAIWKLRAGEADAANLAVVIERERLDLRASVATVQASHKQARLQLDADEALAAQGLVSGLSLELSRSRAEELSTRLEIERLRLESQAEAGRAQVASQRARLEQLRALAGLKRSQVEALQVRAGIDGVLQELPLEVGQQVAPGATLAKVTVPGRLKAELRIPETQARDVVLDQPATIDTHNGVVPGRVVRIDPAVQNGSVTVDVQMQGSMPKGARPDLSVDGTIEIERLADVLQVGRPVFGQEQTTVGLFRLEKGESAAGRVQVRLGRTSVDRIEILGGLAEGDRVILSDTSAWDGFDRIRLR
jgi:HlyD family secretion protein